MLGPPSPDWDADNVVDTANDMMGTGEQPAAAAGVRAGTAWVLIDEHGRPFGGLEPGQDLTVCSGG